MQSLSSTAPSELGVLSGSGPDRPTERIHESPNPLFQVLEGLDLLMHLTYALPTLSQVLR